VIVNRMKRVLPFKKPSTHTQVVAAGKVSERCQKRFNSRLRGLFCLDNIVLLRSKFQKEVAT
jgi:hypothetical protein